MAMPAKPEVVSRLPLAVMGMIVIALYALFREKSNSPMLPILALAMFLSYAVSLRVESESMTWLLRFVLLIIGAVSALVSPGREGEGLLDPRWMIVLGHLCAAELTVQTWRRRPSMSALLVLPCCIFLAAGDTYDTKYLPYMTPAFVLMLALSLPTLRPRAARRWNAVWLQALAVALAILLGGTSYGVVYHYREAINFFGAKLFLPRALERIGLSMDPSLGRTFGQNGSPTRVLRIEGYRGDAYLRGGAFDHYDHGHWLPGMEGRTLEQYNQQDAHPDARETRARVTELAPMDNLLFAPLDVTGLRVDTPVAWSPYLGGPLKTYAPGRISYELICGENRKGSLWPAPNDAERWQLLQVPNEIDPRVHRLAESIGGVLPSAPRKIQAVTNYLMSHHRYSLRTDPGRGDPVSNFLLQQKDAHCEYFASAATILLRCLGVPTRYVVGYFGHETQEDGTIIVRQRDAHAWAESWIDGVGWVTVEGTPGNGRPDETTDHLPSWMLRAKEWLQDRLQQARDWVASLAGWQLGLLALAIVAPYFAWRILRGRKRRQPRKPSGAYRISSRELAELATRFDACLKATGTPCPPSTPWQEHLRKLPPHAKAQAFVSAYNAARFGTLPEEIDAQALRSLLTELENIQLTTDN